uniref:IQ motif containing B1 n=2 Tax=Gouania willdenowi TaxID=441366 RepID=A0A8C5DMH1_GOUWI
MEDVMKLRMKLDDEQLSSEQKVHVLIRGLDDTLNAWRADGYVMTRLKTELYEQGILTHCVHSLYPTMQRGDWRATVTLMQLTSSCCMGLEPLSESADSFYHVFLPSVVDTLLSLAAHLDKRAECVSVFRCIMDSLHWLLSSHDTLCSQVLSSAHYKQLQNSDDVTVSLLCLRLWINVITANRKLLSAQSDQSILLLLNEAVGQLALSEDKEVGGASLRLLLLMTNQLGPRLRPLLLTFRGLDSLLDKDWRGQGFDQDLDQLIGFIQSEPGVRSQSLDSRVQAACVIQAFWRSYQTRRRIKGLNKAVSSLQRRYRNVRLHRQQQEEAQRCEEELRYQECVRRQQERRQFHMKKRDLLQLLPPDQVQSYLQQCEIRAALIIQSCWRGVRARRQYSVALKEARRREVAARTLQRAVRRFLQKCQAVKVPPLPPLWIGQEGLTDSRRAELRQQVDEYIIKHPSSCVSMEECVRLHDKVQKLLMELQRERRGDEQRVEQLLAHTHTQLDKLRDAPPLSVATATDAESFLSPSVSISAVARQAHKAALLANQLPWWRSGDWVEQPHDSAHRQELELEVDFGGLYVG